MLGSRWRRKTLQMMKDKIDVPQLVFLCSAVVTGLIVILMFGFIFWTAIPVFRHEGLGFLFNSVWNYSTDQYGILLYIIGTIVVTVATLILAIPLGLMTAIYLAEFSPPALEKIMRPMVELLVGIPSIVYGIFGFLFLRYFFMDTLDPLIGTYLGFIPIFRNLDISGGTHILLAAVILTIMVIPTIITLSQDAMRAVPGEYREGSLALGATRWETVTRVVIPAAWTGIVTSIILAMMRAMGETMAVVMVAGNSAQIPPTILSPVYPMTAKLLNDVGTYSGLPLPRSALFGIAAVLFLIEIAFVAVARMITSYAGRSME
jgi:phosphate transport system permease protein